MRFIKSLNGQPMALESSSFDGFINTLKSGLTIRDGGLVSRDEDNAVSGISESGVVVLTIEGGLIHSLQGSYWDVVTYSEITQALDYLAGDESVKGVLLQVSSGGGMVLGCQETADYIKSYDKPIHCFVNGMCASAAYWMSSACDHITITRGSLAGAIGAYVARYDFSDDSVHLFAAGETKADGHPFKKMSDEEAQRHTKRIADITELFAQTVADNRDLELSDVLAQESAVYTGQHAVDAGLCDEVGDLQSAVAHLNSVLPSVGAKLETQETHMSDDKQKVHAEAVADDTPAVSESELRAQLTAEIKAEMASNTEAVLALDEAKGNEAVAVELAAKGMSAEDAKDILAKIPSADISAVLKTDEIDDEDEGVEVLANRSESETLLTVNQVNFS